LSSFGFIERTNMKKADIQFLQELCETPSPTGYEWPAAELLRKRLKKTADTIETSVMGSVHATLKGTENGPSVMIAGHIDEIGLIVKYIDDNGFVYFDALGGVDAAILPGIRVNLYATGKGTGGAKDPTKLRGLIGRKPIHLIEADERKNVTPLEKLFIDFGLSGEKAKEMIRIGDCMTFGVGFEQFGDGFAVSRGFDDKMGAFIATLVLEEVKKAGGAKGDVIVAGTVQEEIGLRGATTSTFLLDPDICLCVEVGHAIDYPGVEKSRYGNLVAGKGPIISRGPNINPVFFERLIDAAEAAKAPYQVDAAPRGTGTDANAMQLTRGGKTTALISIPLRYMHTPNETLKIEDLDSAVKMITRFILDLDSEVDWTPGW
ncbi:MAG: M42 family metallopeptidase, partial [Coriobacteriia bacterium]|nr:M42 family metallopeptidase [Coriobacteriia bacterium]